MSYQDFLTGAKKDGAGHKKILECCAYAANDVQMSDGYNELGNFVTIWDFVGQSGIISSMSTGYGLKVVSGEFELIHVASRNVTCTDNSPFESCLGRAYCLPPGVQTFPKLIVRFHITMRLIISVCIRTE